jgi:glutaredoxin
MISRVTFFSKSNCAPCKHLRALFDEEGFREGEHYEYINLDNCTVTYNVKAVPTVRVVKEDGVTQDFEGFRPERLAELLYYVRNDKRMSPVQIDVESLP